MILADTSAWIEYDRATGSSADRRIAELISSDGPLMFTEPVLMEVVAGARTDAREHDLRRLLLRFELAHCDAVSDFDAAARIYRRCLKAGVTPRGMVDCLIAAVAHRRGLSLLAWDADLLRVAEVIGIELDEASLRLAANPIEAAKRQTRLQEVEARFEALPLDAAAARSYGRPRSPS